MAQLRGAVPGLSCDLTEPRARAVKLVQSVLSWWRRACCPRWIGRRRRGLGRGRRCVPDSSTVHRATAGLAAAGNGLIVEHVIEFRSWYDDLLELLAECDVFYVGVECPLPELERRERARGFGFRFRSQLPNQSNMGYCDMSFYPGLDCTGDAIFADDSVPAQVAAQGSSWGEAAGSATAPANAASARLVCIAAIGFGNYDQLYLSRTTTGF